MDGPTQPGNVLDVVARVLLWCFLIGILLLLFWFGCFVLVGDLIHGIHAKMFDLSKHEFDMMNYYGMAYLKLSVFLFFLIPYLAVRLALRGQMRPDGASQPAGDSPSCQ